MINRFESRPRDDARAERVGSGQGQGQGRGRGRGRERHHIVAGQEIAAGVGVVKGRR